LKAIDWLCRAFGFEVRLKCLGENQELVHSELTYGDGLIMVGGTGRSDPGREQFQKLHKSPQAVSGANTQSLCVYVDDVDAHCAHARKEGATITSEPQTSDYGPEYWADRSYSVLDCEGHHWWFMQRVRNQGE